MSEAEKPLVDQTVLLTEIFAEVQGAKEESRAIIEHLAGKVAVLTATVEGFEATLKSASSQGAVIRRIWLRALVITGGMSGLATAAILLMP